MENDIADRLLMSDSLKGMIPALEDAVTNANLELVIASIVTGPEASDVLTGRLTGVSVDPDVVKLDVRVATDTAFDLLRRSITTGVSIAEVFLSLSDDDVRITGPFRVTSPKMLDFDTQNKMCTLGLDLIKVT